MLGQFTLRIAKCPSCGGTRIVQPDPDHLMYECSDCEASIQPEQVIFEPVDRTRKNAETTQSNPVTVS